MLRPCLGIEGEPCGELTPNTRCPTHAREWERSRPSRRVRGRYDTRYLKLRTLTLREQPWCTECRTPGTESNPLTADHIVPLQRGGRNVRSNMQTMCRACNSAKRDRLAAPKG